MSEQLTQPTFRLFLDGEDIIAVSRTLASAIGLNESIVLRQLHYWLANNKRNKKGDHYRDECWWAFNTYAQWRDENFEFWSIDTVRRAIKVLESMVLIRAGNYNRRSGDQTKWYTINYGAYEAFMLLWRQHGSPRASDGAKSAAYVAFLEDWNAQKKAYTNLASCIDQLGNLHRASCQVAQTITRDYAETNTEKKSAARKRAAAPRQPLKHKQKASVEEHTLYKAYYEKCFPPYPVTLTNAEEYLSAAEALDKAGVTPDELGRYVAALPTPVSFKYLPDRVGHIKARPASARPAPKVHVMNPADYEDKLTPDERAAAVADIDRILADMRGNHGAA